MKKLIEKIKTKIFKNEIRKITELESYITTLTTEIAQLQDRVGNLEAEVHRHEMTLSMKVDKTEWIQA